MKAKIDAESRVVIPGTIHNELGIKPNDEVIVEKIADNVIISKSLSPEEFLEEAHLLAEDIRKTKIRKIDPLKIKQIWER